MSNPRFKQALGYHLLHWTELIALVGDRIEPMDTIQGGTYPRITYQMIAGERMHEIDGPAGYSMPRVQFDVWAETYTAASAIAEVLIGEQSAGSPTGLDGFIGTMGASPDALKIQSVELTTPPHDLSERPINADDVRLKRISMDFTFYFNEDGT